jgi:hypothetical protein
MAGEFRDAAVSHPDAIAMLAITMTSTGKSIRKLRVLLLCDPLILNGKGYSLNEKGSSTIATPFVWSTPSGGTFDKNRFPPEGGTLNRS